MEGRSVLSGCRGEAQSRARDRLFIAKINMAMGCRGVGGEEVGVKCGGKPRGCDSTCEGARPGVRAQRSMEQVAVIMKTNRVGAVALQSWVSPPRAHD